MKIPNFARDFSHAKKSIWQVAVADLEVPVRALSASGARFVIAFAFASRARV